MRLSQYGTVVSIVVATIIILLIATFVLVKNTTAKDGYKGGIATLPLKITQGK